MGLRASLWKLLARGGGGKPDPDEMVELVRVPEYEAPVMQASLSAHDIDSSLEEVFDLITSMAPSSRVLVRRADLPAAREVITA